MKTTITIDKDGWVWIKRRPAPDGFIEEGLGLGDIGVDVEIIDKRNEKTTH